MNSDRVYHEFPPLYDKRSRVLILGSIPSPKSRELGFYYMHPQNRFWKMLSSVLGEEFPLDKQQRMAMCLRHGIALWDVLQSCEITGASDSSIRNAVPNKLEQIFDSADIKAVFTTGKKAQALYCRFFGDNKHPAVCLPSTSPANRTISEQQMLMEYSRIRDYL